MGVETDDGGEAGDEVGVALGEGGEEEVDACGRADGQAPDLVVGLVDGGAVDDQQTRKDETTPH